MTKRITGERVYYNDVLFFLVLIPVVNALNYYLTYTNIPFNTHTIVTFLLDTVEGYIAWLGFRSVVIYLDKKMPYGTRPLKRILVQILSSSAASLLIIIILTELSNAIATNKPVPQSFYHYDIFIFLIWFIGFNAVYIGLHYYHAMKQVEKLRLEDKKIRSEGFAVKDGRQNLVVGFDTILGFFVDDDYTALVISDTKKYLLDRSLDNIEGSLPQELFFRLNRQYLVHRNMVKGFNRVENGKLNVLLLDSAYFPVQVQVSRTKAPDFKNWFTPVEDH